MKSVSHMIEGALKAVTQRDSGLPCTQAWTCSGPPPQPPMSMSLDFNPPIANPQVFELPVNAFVLEFISDA